MEQIEPQILKQRLADTYIVPPFNTLDGKQKDWLNRKRKWNKLINDKGQARATAKAYNNAKINNKLNYSKNGTMSCETSIFDPVLAEILLTWFTDDDKKNVIDPFAGDTVIGYVAGALNKNFVGIELRQEQVAFNAEQTKCFNSVKYINDDAQNVLKHVEKQSQDLLISCPPYYDLEVYSDLENDASNQGTYQDFINILDKAYTDALTTLKDNRFAIIICGDVRDKKSGYYYGFPEDIISIFKKSGFGLYNKMILLTPFGTAQIRASGSMKNKKPVNIYQQVLVFYSGTTNNIKNEFKPVQINNYIEENYKNESNDVEQILLDWFY